MGTFRRPEGVQGGMIPAVEMPSETELDLTGEASRELIYHDPSYATGWGNILHEMFSETDEVKRHQQKLARRGEAAEPNQCPTADEVFQKFLLEHIQESRWARYIIPGPASRVFDSTIFIYDTPSNNFWSLYNLSKGLFSDLGIRLSKTNCVWEARLPICVLTDEVFVDSGLAAVEKTLLAHTGIDPTRTHTSQRTVQQIAIEQGMKRIDAAIVAEEAYWERNDVEAKRAVAMRLYDERVQPQAATEKAVTGDPQPNSAEVGEMTTQWSSDTDRLANKVPQPISPTSEREPLSLPRIDELGEKYGMQFSDFETFTESSKHLSYESLIDENGDWLNRCDWAFPTDAFWVAWRKAKNALKSTGYETIKIECIWLVYVWRKPAKRCMTEYR